MGFEEGSSRNDIIITGRGEYFRYLTRKQDRDERSGKMVWRFEAKVPKALVDYYGVRDRVDPARETVILTYDEVHVVVLRESNYGSLVLVETDLLGGETVLSRRNIDLKIKAQEYQKEVKTLRSAVAKRDEDLHNAYVQQEKLAKDFTQLIKTVRAATKVKGIEAYETGTELGGDSAEEM